MSLESAGRADQGPPFYPGSLRRVRPVNRLPTASARSRSPVHRRKRPDGPLRTAAAVAGRQTPLYDALLRSPTAGAPGSPMRGTGGDAPAAITRMSQPTSQPAHGRIAIRGARTHNLQNIDLTLPKRQIIVVTGVSGSGKSSLAFDNRVRGGAAALRRVAFRLRPAVPRADGEAGRRPHRRHLPGHRDPPEEQRPQPPLHRRHHGPRCTTTCACCSRGSAARSAGAAARRSCGRPPRSSPGGSRRGRTGRGC